MSNTRSSFLKIAEGIWAAEAAVKMPAMHLPARCVAVQVAPKKLVLISPLHTKMCDYSTLTPHGEVIAIVAPSQLHHLFILHAKKQFPDAKLWGAPGLEVKRPEVKWDGILTRDNWPYSEVLKIQFIRGVPKMNEVVFLHQATKTLLVTDLFFNLQHVSGLGARMVTTLMGTFRKLNTSRLMFWVAKDRTEVNESLKQVLSLDFDRLVMAHGDIVHQGAKAQVKPILEKHIQTTH